MLFARFRQTKGKFFVIFSFLILLVSLPSFASVVIPAEYGKIQNQRQGWNGKTLYLIQEAHVQYEAQKSITHILNSLIDQKAVRLILVEGGWNDVSLASLREGVAEKKLQEVADAFLKDGKISAEEYVNLTRCPDLVLWGIENPELYKQNIQAFVSLEDHKTVWQSALRDARLQIEALKKKIYPKTLLDWDQKRQAWKHQEISWMEYLQAFRGRSLQMERFPYLSQFLTLLADQDALDFSKIKMEKEEAFRVLQRNVSQLELKTLAVLMGKTSPEAEQQFLSELEAVYQRYPRLAGKAQRAQLGKYHALLASMNRFPVKKIMREFLQADQEALESMASTDPARQLLSVGQQLEALETLLKLEMTPEAFRDFSAQNISLADWKKEHDLLALAHQGVLLGETTVRTLESALLSALSFYRTAIEREQALLNNAVLKLNRTPDLSAVMITGGFHSEALAEALHQKGYSVVELAPHFQPGDAQADQQKYFEILKTKSGNLLDSARVNG